MTDRALQGLTELPQLQSLTLGGTGVTDASVKVLSGLKQLRYLSLPAQVTNAALKELRESLPQAIVASDRGAMEGSFDTRISGRTRLRLDVKSEHHRIRR